MGTFQVVLPQVDCDSADEFLDAISPLGPFFKDFPLADRWLFRGQCGDYPLVPSAYRSDGRLKSLTKHDVRDPSERRLAERDILIRFFDIADRRGLILPDDSQELRDRLELFNSNSGDQFVPKGWDGWKTYDMALSLMALAQHYGIPTPLLDWSRQSLIAAFFAAEGAASRTEHPGVLGRLVVWAFHYPMMGKQGYVGRGSALIRIVTAPSATNSNLKPNNMFTLFQPQYTREQRAEDRPMEEVLAELSAEAEPEKSDQDKIVVDCQLRKFALPASQAGRLLYLLAKLDVTPSAIYPGYASIVRDLEQENRF